MDLQKFILFMPLLEMHKTIMQHDNKWKPKHIPLAWKQIISSFHGFLQYSSVPTAPEREEKQMTQARLNSAKIFTHSSHKIICNTKPTIE